MARVLVETLKSPGAVLLISCYELGRQPLATASARAAIQSKGFSPAAIDLAVDKLTPGLLGPAKVAVISVPMHTALRIGTRVVTRIREMNPDCRIVCHGLYAHLNAAALFQAGVDYVIAGEFEEPLAALLESLESIGDHPVAVTTVPGVSTPGHTEAPWLRKITFHAPDRHALPHLSQYARLDHNGEQGIAGHTEASRGCRHFCRHCPIPPVYEGRFFIVPRDIVVADIRNQVDAGATHITFGDPDFLNGPGHTMAIVREMHAEFPEITFDFTTKVEHILKHMTLLPELSDLGCLFVVSAVESLNDRILEILDKGHTRSDAVAALAALRGAGIEMRPTWVSFTPWTSLDDYLDVLSFIEGEDLTGNVDPIQMSVRLLVPPGSLLAGHEAMRPYLGELDPAAFSHRWKHPDPSMDELQAEVGRVVAEASRSGEGAGSTFQKIMSLARAFGGSPEAAPWPSNRIQAARGVPRLTEPWFC
jgi:hypothetical protein